MYWLMLYMQLVTSITLVQSSGNHALPIYPDHYTWQLQPFYRRFTWFSDLKKIFLRFIHFLETETAHEWGRGRERGRHRTQSRLQALSCQHRAPWGAWTHERWDHDLSWSRSPNRMSHPGTPPGNNFLSDVYVCIYLYMHIDVWHVCIIYTCTEWLFILQHV